LGINKINHSIPVYGQDIGFKRLLY
jgi:hypothetical protein